MANKHDTIKAELQSNADSKPLTASAGFGLLATTLVQNLVPVWFVGAPPSLILLPGVSEGDMAYDTLNHHYYFFNGTTFVLIA